MKDTLFQNAVVNSGSFEFNESVTEVFEDMINRSVPGYESIIALTGLLASRYITSHSNCYDLGCSLGAGLQSMVNGCNSNLERVKFIGVDNSAAMVNACKQLFINHYGASNNIGIIQANIQDITMEKASLVAMNFTLQFIEQSQRFNILQNIYNALNEGGAFILSEKISSADETTDQEMIALYEQFKMAKGYSQLEIAKKRDALEGVLIPESLEIHKQRLQQVGFLHCFVWFQCFNFCSILALK